MRRGPNLETIAQALGVTRPRVSQLKAKGMPVSSVEAAREWRASHVRPQFTVLSEPTVPTVDAQIPTDVVYDIGEARARREHHEANIAAMREAQLAGSLVAIDRVRLALTTLAAEVRNAFERIPDKLAEPLAAESAADQIHALLTGAIGEVLEDLARSVTDLDFAREADDRH